MVATPPAVISLSSSRALDCRACASAGHQSPRSNVGQGMRLWPALLSRQAGQPASTSPTVTPVPSHCQLLVRWAVGVGDYWHQGRRDSCMVGTYTQPVNLISPGWPLALTGHSGTISLSSPCALWPGSCRDRRLLAIRTLGRPWSLSTPLAQLHLAKLPPVILASCASMSLGADFVPDATRSPPYHSPLSASMIGGKESGTWGPTGAPQTIPPSSARPSGRGGFWRLAARKLRPIRRALPSEAIRRGRLPAKPRRCARQGGSTGGSACSQFLAVAMPASVAASLFRRAGVWRSHNVAAFHNGPLLSAKLDLSRMSPG
jgi:hypothetical protein